MTSSYCNDHGRSSKGLLQTCSVNVREQVKVLAGRFQKPSFETGISKDKQTCEHALLGFRQMICCCNKFAKAVDINLGVNGVLVD
ncbi:hypothetical protein G4B88_030131 [Cannabis sativa]|uniref:Uncharacterized protein n=1 Tax=Cannabis sativa TaxID=3483 RepID=A0A7J6ED71_CANSA|nr:hypothetical protein G4B88_030131 [Cannabis sativa]